MDVFICARDNEDTLPDTFRCLEDCERSGFAFRFYVYENDSSDATPGMIADFLADRDGVLLSESIGTETFGHVVSRRRVECMAACRNACASLCKRPQPLSLVLDTNITFAPGTLRLLAQALAYDGACVGACAYGVDEFSQYYDTYALRTAAGAKTLPLTTGAMIPVRSAFGGMALYRSQQFRAAAYGVPCSIEDNEHVFLSDELRDHGVIVIVKGATCRWKRD